MTELVFEFYKDNQDMSKKTFDYETFKDTFYYDLAKSLGLVKKTNGESQKRLKSVKDLKERLKARRLRQLDEKTLKEVKYSKSLKTGEILLISLLNDLDKNEKVIEIDNKDYIKTMMTTFLRLDNYGQIEDLKSFIEENRHEDIVKVKIYLNF